MQWRYMINTALPPLLQGPLYNQETYNIYCRFPDYTEDLVVVLLRLIQCCCICMSTFKTNMNIKEQIQSSRPDKLYLNADKII